MRFLEHWVKHFALNLGFALSSLLYMWLPPQWHHTAEELEGFDDVTFWRCLLDGLGIRRPK
jgi:hypothetical protein